MKKIAIAKAIYLGIICLKGAPGKFQGLFSPHTSPSPRICTGIGTPYNVQNGGNGLRARSEMGLSRNRLGTRKFVGK